MHLKHGHASAITKSSCTLRAEEDMRRAAVQVSWGWFMLQSWAVAQDTGSPSLAPALHLLQRLRCLGERCGSCTSAKNLGNARCVPLAQRGRGALLGFTPHSPRDTHLAPGCGSCPPPWGSTHLPLPGLVLQMSQSIFPCLLQLATSLSLASLLAFLPLLDPGGEKNPKCIDF